MNPRYRLPQPKLAQGDIFDGLPSIYVPDPTITFVRRRQMKSGPGADLYFVGDLDHRPSREFDPNGDEMVVDVQLASGMLLTHGCEIDNRPKASVSLALIRPLRTVPDPQHRQRIRDGRNLAFLPLPENDDPAFEESCVDFSRITSVKVAGLPLDRRILSASDDLLRALYVGYVRYITRYDNSAGSDRAARPAGCC